MNLDELVPMPKPDFSIYWRGWGYTVTKPNIGRADVYTTDQLRADREAIARAVAERCAEICKSEFVDAEATGCPDDRVYNLALEHASDAIRREFLGVRNG